MRSNIGVVSVILVCMLLLVSCDQVGNNTEITEITTEATDTEQNRGINVIQTPPEEYIFKNEDVYFLVTPKGLPNEGILFSDLSLERRGSHFGHAMVEYADGCILAFYPNCNFDNRGHSGRGWMEYKRSTDYGKTWSDPIILEYSYNMFRDSEEKRSTMSEKAVRAPDGKIILFNVVCDVETTALWEPYYAPTYIVSEDGGESWSEARKLDIYRGRVYDAMVLGDRIYVLVKYASSGAEDSGYRIYRSDDNGNTFDMIGKINFNRSGSYYGTLGVLDDGRFIVYVYNETDETKLEYATSENGGISWSVPQMATFAKKIRNPQLAKLENSYFMFGRSGSFGDNSGHIVMYASRDGINWDEGRYMRIKTK